jgi:DNA polymerase-3 subunit gamma/tau
MSAVIATAPVAKAQADGYVVLARKYRPQTFDDIVGQEGVQQALRGAIATGQISHSYLFSGPRGTGKTSTARILAKALNCQENGPRPDPCGRCSSCRSITVGSSLDVIEIDAASNTGVDNIRELKSGVVLAPFSRYKVYIVDEVHMLSNQAFNALLKTLEEPPPQVIFILATTELHKVPETIISRCQTFMFRRFSLVELKNQLGNIMDIEASNRGLTVSAEDREKILDLVARSAEGGMRDAQVTLDQVLVLSKGTIDFDSVRRFLGMADTEALDLFVFLINERKSRELLELIDQLATGGQDLELFVKGACEHMRDLLLIKCAGRETTMINVSEDRGIALETLAKSLPSQFLVKAVDEFLKVVGEMKVSGQPRIVLELAVLKLILPDTSRDLETILKRLDALEQGIKPEDVAPAAPQVKSQPVASLPSTRVQTADEGRPGTQLVAAPDTPSHTATDTASSGDITPPQNLATHPVGDANAMVEALATRLKTEPGMLSLTFEKVLLGQELNGHTLTLFVNESLKMSFNQLMRPQNVEALTKLATSLFGEQVVLRLQPKEGQAVQTPVAEPPPERYRPEPPASAVVKAPPAELQSIKTTRVDLSAEMPVDDGPLKIYYPEEIREKTMLEVKDSEFHQILTNDSALKDLVEKTKRIFGIDEKCVKFHRSTLT